MTRVTDAVYVNGLLRPLEPLPLEEQQVVRTTVEFADKHLGERQAARQRMIDGFDKLKLDTGGRAPKRDALYDR